jgi:3-dehydroquinate synthetase
MSEADELREEVRELLIRHDLPTRLSGTNIEDVVEAVGRDKKKTSKGIGFVLLRRPGEPRESQIMSQDSIRAAVNTLLNAE